MADRPARLGDVIDDYCPRCRLLLNHDVASLVGGTIAKVTCRTCFNSHDYRHGEVPKRRGKKDEKKKLMDEVLANLPVPPGAAAATPPAATPPAAAAPATPALPPPPPRKKRDLWAELERINAKKK
jgi:hypothetical protein